MRVFVLVHKDGHRRDAVLEARLERSVRAVVAELVSADGCASGNSVVLMPDTSPLLADLANSHPNRVLPLPPDWAGDAVCLSCAAGPLPRGAETSGPVHGHACVPSAIDLVVTVGGDGTVLAASWMLQRCAPPILPLHCGTVGFLNAHAAEADELRRTLCRGVLRVTERLRLCCTVVRDMGMSPGSAPASPGGPAQLGESIKFTFADVGTDALPARHVLNELVIDRGSSPQMLTLDVFADGRRVTTVQADGLIVATPTGSTAYSLSAGGSVVHPAVPALVITPICAHTLSMRPLLLPASSELVVRVADPQRVRGVPCPGVEACCQQAMCSSGGPCGLIAQSAIVAQATLDGRERIPLCAGDGVAISASHLAVRTVCRRDVTSDWFHGLAVCLHWNVRPAWGVPIDEP